MKNSTLIVLMSLICPGFLQAQLQQIDLPVDFEQGPYDFQDFDGGTATVIDNPQPSGINTSLTVAQIVRNGGAIWAGSKLRLDDRIDFSINNTFSMKVYSTRAGIPVLFKLEGPNAATEVSVNTSLANEWETLSWDFTGTASNTFDELVFMFDFGSVGDSSVNSTFLFDDIEIYDITGGLSQIDLPVTFDNPSVYYELSDFDGASTLLGASPTDATNTVAITTRESGSAPWAGTTIGTGLGFATRIPFTESETKMSVGVYSPTAGTPVLLKAEDHKDATKTAETFSYTTVANVWETLSFDFSKVAPGTNPFNLGTHFDKVSVMFNKGIAGTGETYYWDDVVFGGSGSTAISFEENNSIRLYSYKSTIHVECSEGLIYSQIEVFDITGRKILSSTIANTNEQLNLSSKGVFIVRIINPSVGGVITQKLIIR